jgi:hypothetical protein
VYVTSEEGGGAGQTVIPEFSNYSVAEVCSPKQIFEKSDAKGGASQEGPPFRFVRSLFRQFLILLRRKVQPYRSAPLLDGVLDGLAILQRQFVASPFSNLEDFGWLLQV